jgi:hypothetical protein
VNAQKSILLFCVQQPNYKVFGLITYYGFVAGCPKLAESRSLGNVVQRLLWRNFLDIRGGNPKSSDFAATIINQFAEADAQNAFTSGGFRPEAVTRL